MHIDSDLKIKDIIDENGIWDLTYLNPLVNTQALEEISRIYIPRFTDTPDTIQWAGNVNDKFLVASAYCMLNQADSDTTGWKWFWKIKIPQKLKSAAHPP